MVDSSQERIAAPHIIIPMAGHGKRFREQGFQMDKPLIPVGGRLMLDWVLDALPEKWGKNWNWIISVLREEQWELRDSLKYMEAFKTCIIPGPTQGAACTVLAAAVGLPPDEPVVVMNADQWVDIDIESVYKTAISQQWDGFILTFDGTGPGWSYAITDGTTQVVRVIEKQQVSPYATCGVYWFRRAGDLVKAISSMIYKEDRTNGEFYLAPAFNHLERDKRNVHIVPVKEFHGLGTPEQVKEFEALLATGWRV